MFQAYAHVWTADYRYWNFVGEPQETEAGARAVIVAEADKWWPGDKNPSRRAAFLSRCRVTGPDLPALPPA